MEPQPKCVVAPTSGAETKLNAGAHLQTFHYPTVSKAFPYSTALMAMLLARRTNKNIENFRYRSRAMPEPHSTGSVW